MSLAVCHGSPELFLASLCNFTASVRWGNAVEFTRGKVAQKSVVSHPLVCSLGFVCEMSSGRLWVSNVVLVP